MIDTRWRLDGKVALLTGAGRGIGLSMAKTLAAAGAAVVIQDIDLSVAETEAEAIVASGGTAVALGGDITDPQLPYTLVRETVKRLGGIHILINNAAIQSSRPWLTLTLEELEREFHADLVAPIRLCQVVTPIFQGQKFGRIINLGSIQQQGGNPGMLPYSLSKVGLVGLTTALARSLAKDQITVNLIAPGYINTWRNRHEFRTQQDVIERGKWVPMGRVGEPADFDGITLLLCSDAGAYITGQSIYVDGGMSTQ
jgi:NAD(P)-dependent dehydrogenase (short-subunit alcohol dehydrogenase family)